MKLTRHFITFWMVITFSFCSYSQSLLGLWQGYITADGYPNKAYYAIYITEHTENMIYGRAYLNRPDLSTGAYSLVGFAGSVNNDQISFTELQMIDVLEPAAFLVCMKFCKLTLNTANGTHELSGRWKGDSKYCEPGDVYFKRFSDSVFNRDSIPQFVYNDITAPEKPISFVKRTLQHPIVVPIKGSAVVLEISDYLKPDNDTVSLYVNRTIFKSKIPVTKKTQIFKLRLNRNSDVNEIILFAENLGKIPPNTSLLTVVDGKERHSIRIETSLQKNAVIYLKSVPHPQ